MATQAASAISRLPFNRVDCTVPPRIEAWTVDEALSIGADARMSELPLPVFQPGEKVCGNCKLWFPHSVDARGWVGPCRLQPNRGMFPPSAPICNAFVAKGSAVVAQQAPVERARPVRSV